MMLCRSLQMENIRGKYANYVGLLSNFHQIFYAVVLMLVEGVEQNVEDFLLVFSQTFDFIFLLRLIKSI